MASASLNDSGSAGNGLQGLMPVLSIVNGKPRASSLTIAEHFKKRHKDVLRSITQTRHNLPKEFDGRNFAPVEYTDSKGEQRAAYLMTRDGFTLIVMSFTGKEAMAWKLRYIEAFNAMEAELADRTGYAKAVDAVEAELMGPSPDLSRLTTVEDRRPLKALVDAWVAAAKTNGKFLTHTEAFRIARTPVSGRKMKELTLADVPVAMAWVQEQLDRELKAASPLALPVGEGQPALAPAIMDVTMDAKLRRLRAIKQEMMDLTADIYHVAKRSIRPRMTEHGRPAFSHLVNLNYVVEDVLYGLDRNLDALEHLCVAGELAARVFTGSVEAGR